jgi:glutamate dehydrogenase
MAAKPRTVDNVSGYNANVFAGKNEQMVQVCTHLESTGFVPKELVKNEVAWFYG